MEEGYWNRETEDVQNILQERDEQPFYLLTTLKILNSQCSKLKFCGIIFHGYFPSIERWQ